MMPASIVRNKFSPLLIFSFSAFVVLILFIWQSNMRFNLWDEGFLWYGAQRVMQGEIPIRDFNAYDPGRYYWSAAFMSLWGDNGIVALRGSLAIFQIIGLFVSLLLVSRTIKKQNLFFLLLAAIILTTWMFPRFRMFDISLSILLISILAFLVENPTYRRYFFTGFCVGLVAVFGRNHGVYGIVGSVGVMIWLNIKSVEGPGLIKGFILWSAGVITGFMPILFMVLLIPGFAIAFWESIYFLLFEIKGTNLPLPVPWPWLVDFAALSVNRSIQGVFVGLLFIAIIIFGVLSISWVVLQKVSNKQVPPTLVAASFLALPYAQYSYSRAALDQLTLGIFPMLVGCLVILSTQKTKVKLSLALILCIVSIHVTYKSYPSWHCRAGKACVNIEISGSDIRVRGETARDIKLLRKLTNQYARDGRSFIATPLWPGAYSLLERKSPMWDIYALFPRSQSFEKAEIERIKVADPGFALIFDFPLDGRDELRFKNTHPLIHQYILDNFERIPDSPNPAYQIYRAKKRHLMKKVAIPQSNNIPWKGYLDLIAVADELILYDDM